MSKDEALKLALEVLKEAAEFGSLSERAEKSVKALEEALKQEQGELVARVTEVHMSRDTIEWTIEWTNGPLPEGTELLDGTLQTQSTQTIKEQ
jgi:hypothetical protein